MSALARYFKSQGKAVSGYDRTRTALTDELTGEGMTVYYRDDISLLPEVVREDDHSGRVVVVYTPAIPEEFGEIRFFRDKNISLYKRAEILGMLSRQIRTIAVAGTHGKTTTSSLLAMMLQESGLDFVAFVGGINENFNSNLLIRGNPSLMLTEADEYDRSFLHLDPAFAAITSVDADHLDIYGDAESMIDAFDTFCSSVSDTVWINEGIGEKLRHADGKTYGFSSRSDAFIENIRNRGHVMSFDLVTEKGEFRELEMNLPGHHNVENCCAAICLALEIGIDEETIRRALSKYRGVRRRI